jgi:peptide/nickel transport system permease protein
MRIRKLLRSKSFLYGAILTIIVAMISLIAPLISPYDASEFSIQRLSPPSKIHLLGTDEHGRDLFSRILRGGRVTLSLAISIIGIAGTFGILWGLIAAYVKGIAADILSRSIDFALSFPSIMTALIILSIAGSAGKTPLIIAIAFALAPRFARVIRGTTLPILQEEFILAEKALGASHLRILAIHLLPNLVGQITVLISIYLPFVIILEASLSFLGLGAPPDVPTWGRVISDGKVYMQVAPWLTIFPGITIVLTALAFNLLGDGMRDLLDPKSVTRLYDR